MFNLNVLNQILEKHEEEKSSKTEKLPLKYSNYVSDKIPQILEVINNNKTTLIEAPTGGGKTRAVVEIMKNYDDGETLNILLTPAVIQNKQNAKSYKQFGIKSFTEYDTKITSNLLSATYDKSNYLFEYLKAKDIKVNLFIDECHLMVQAINYRKNAIDGIIKLSQRADKIIYMSATIKNMEHIFSVDKIIKLEPINQINPYSTSQIIYLNDKNYLSQFIDDIVKFSKIEGRKTTIFLDDKKKINQIKEILIKKGFKTSQIDVIHAQNKDSATYNEIIERSALPAKVLIVITTSVLEVGTNINTTNLNVFYLCTQKDRLSFNSIEQKTARIRNGGNNILRLYFVDREQPAEYIPSITSIRDNILEQVKGFIDIEEKALNYLGLTSPSDKASFWEHQLNTPMSIFSTSLPLAGRICDIDEEGNPQINHYKLEKVTIDLYDSLFYYNKEKLKERLESIIKCDVWLDDIVMREVEEIAEIKENEKLLKEEKEHIKNVFKECISEIIEHDLSNMLLEKVLDQNLETGIGAVEEVYSFISENTKAVNLIKEGYKQNLEIDEILNFLLEHGDNKQKFLKLIKIKENINLNRALPIGSEVTLEKVPRKEYVFTRNQLDTVCKKQGTITKQIKLNLMIMLIENNFFGGSYRNKFEIIKGDIYHKGKEVTSKGAKQKNTPKKITSTTMDKLTLELIQSIYNISKDRNQFKISSLL